MRAYEFIPKSTVLESFDDNSNFEIINLKKPWNEKILMKGILPCFERNYNITGSDLLKEMNYPPEDPRIEIYVFIDKKDSHKISYDIIHGFYILRSINIGDVHPIKQFPQLAKWKGRGIQGLCLAVDKEYRNLRIGKTFMEIPYKLNGYDYIWGEHLHSLGNLNNWLKRRELVLDRNDIDPPYYVTATYINK